MMQAPDFSLTIQNRNLPEILNAVRNFSSRIECYDRHLSKKIFQKLLYEFTLAVVDKKVSIDDHSWTILNRSFLDIFKASLPANKSKNDLDYKTTTYIKKKKESNRNLEEKRAEARIQIKYDRRILKLVRLVHQIQTVSQRTLNPLPPCIRPLTVVIENFESFIIPYTLLESYFKKEFQELTKLDFQVQKNEQILELRGHSSDANKLIKKFLLSDGMMRSQDFPLEVFNEIFDFACAYEIDGLKVGVVFMAVEILLDFMNDNQFEKCEEFYMEVLEPLCQKKIELETVLVLSFPYLQHLLYKDDFLREGSSCEVNKQNINKYVNLSYLFYQTGCHECQEFLVIAEAFSDYAENEFFEDKGPKGNWSSDSFVKEVLNPAYDGKFTAEQPYAVREIRESLINEFHPCYFDISYPVHLTKGSNFGGQPYYRDLFIDLDSNDVKNLLNHFFAFQYPHMENVIASSNTVTSEEFWKKTEILIDAMFAHPCINFEKIHLAFPEDVKINDRAKEILEFCKLRCIGISYGVPVPWNT